MSEAALARLGGPERAAILLVSLGEECAAEVLKRLGPREVQQVGESIAAMRSVSPDEVQAVLDAFLEDAGARTALGADSAGYLRRVLEQALGPERAAAVAGRILGPGTTDKGLEALRWMDGRSVAELIGSEHPQVIAIILANLDREQAAEALGALPAEVRPEVLLRVARLDAVRPEALAELDAILERQMSSARPAPARGVGGARAAAEILNFVDPSLESEALERIKSVDADLGDQIQDLMFVFENLAEVDDTGIQTLLREVSSESLLLALKGTDEDLREKFFRNMSRRAAEMLRDDLEAKGPVRVSEVEAAQKEILGIAQRLAEEGQIMLGGRGGDDFV